MMPGVCPELLGEWVAFFDGDTSLGTSYIWKKIMTGRGRGAR